MKVNLSIVLIRWLLSSQDFTGHQGCFFICEKFPSFLNLLVFFSWYFNIVWPWVYFSLPSTCKVSRKCHRTKEKGTITKSQIFVCGGLGNFPQKIFAQRKRKRNSLDKLYCLQKICCSFLVVDTRSVEPTIRMGQNMQMYHSLGWKRIDMSTADQLISIFSNSAGMPNKTFLRDSFC